MAEQYDADVVVIGSGAPGGRFQRKDFWTHVKGWQRAERLRRGEQPTPFCPDRAEQPYTTVADRPFDLTPWCD